MTPRLGQRMPDHKGAAVMARGERGMWVLAAVYSSRKTARMIASNVERGVNTSYRPAGDFEAYTANIDAGAVLWVRFVGGRGLPKVPELPVAMTVNVPDFDTESDGIPVVRVTISSLCPRCGGPRGFDRVIPQRIQARNSWYVWDHWTNPCDHRDDYRDVLAEARGLPAVPAIPDGGRYGAAVQTILTAARGARSMHATQVVPALEEAGHTKAAQIIRNELQSRRGQMSAKQAAHHLHVLGGGGPR
ncbi:hypothetical protein ABZ312_09960 [Streptomyces sp. NPDC006207]